MLRLRRQLRVSHEAKHAQPVIEADKHDALLGEILAVILVFRSGSAYIPAAVDVHHHRQLFTGAFRGRPDIQIKTVLADGS